MSNLNVKCARKMAANSTKQQWWVYFVECRDGTLYTGISTNLDRRLAQHNGDQAGGAKYTKSRRPVRLVYAEPCDDRSAASRREYQLRKLPKAGKHRLILEQEDRG